MPSARGGRHLALLTAKVRDPSGLGRIVRDTAGHVRAIVEERDATAAERAMDEINTGMLVAPTALLRRWLAALTDDNAQREYYLTDIVGWRSPTAWPSRDTSPPTGATPWASTTARSSPSSSASSRRGGARR